MVLVAAGLTALQSRPVRSARSLVGSPHPARPLTAPAEATPAEDALALTARIDGFHGGAFAVGATAYVSHDFRIHLYDLSDPTAPKLLRSGPQVSGRPALLPGNLARIAVRGELVFGLVEWDRALPEGPDQHLILVVLDRNFNLRAKLELPGFTRVHDAQPYALELTTLDDRYVLVAETEAEGHRLRVVDVANPSAPALVGSYVPGSLPIGLATAGGYAYLLVRDNAERETSVETVNLADPTAPRQSDILSPVSGIDIVTADDHAYVVSCHEMQAFSLAQPGRPARVLPPPTPTATGPGPTATPAPGPPAGIECYGSANAEWAGGLIYTVGIRWTSFTDIETVLVVYDVRAPDRPMLLSTTVLSGGAERITVGEGFAVLGDSSDGLHVADLGQPGQPRAGAELVGPLMLPFGLAAEPGLVVRSLAYGFTGELQVIVPGHGVVGRMDIPAPTGYEVPTSLVVHAGVVYGIADGQLQIVDARDPTRPRRLGTLPTAGSVRTVAAAGQSLYVIETAKGGASTPGALRVFDVANPAQPAEVGHTDGDFLTVTATTDHVFASLAVTPTIQVFATAHGPGAAPLTLVGTASVSGAVHTLIVDGQRLYALDADGVLSVIDISDPRQPSRLGIVQLEKTPIFRRGSTGLSTIAARGTTVYAGYIGRLQTIDAADPSAPRIVATRIIPARPDIAAAERIAYGGAVAIADRDVYIEGDSTGLWGFGAGTLAGTTETFEGLYWANFEHSQFAPTPQGCPTDGDWWYLHLTSGGDFEQRYRAIYPNYNQPIPGGSGYVWARFEGSVTAPSPGAYTWFRDRAVTVTKVLDMWPVPDCRFAGRASLWLPWLGAPSR
jgi:hypothetical protein